MANHVFDQLCFCRVCGVSMERLASGEVSDDCDPKVVSLDAHFARRFWHKFKADWDSKYPDIPLSD